MFGAQHGGRSTDPGPRSFQQPVAKHQSRYLKHGRVRPSTAINNRAISNIFKHLASKKPCCEPLRSCNKPMQLPGYCLDPLGLFRGACGAWSIISNPIRIGRPLVISGKWRIFWFSWRSKKLRIPWDYPLNVLNIQPDGSYKWDAPNECCHCEPNDPKW